jgi:uncharacterized protein YuzE
MKKIKIKCDDQDVKLDRWGCGYVRVKPFKKSQVVGTIPWSWENFDINIDYDKKKELVGIEFLKRYKVVSRGGKL